MTLMFIELHLFLLGSVAGPVVPWDPTRRVGETGQAGGHPAVASWFFLFHLARSKRESLFYLTQRSEERRQRIILKNLLTVLTKRILLSKDSYNKEGNILTYARVLSQPLRKINTIFPLMFACIKYWLQIHSFWPLGKNTHLHRQMGPNCFPSPLTERVMKGQLKAELYSYFITGTNKFRQLQSPFCKQWMCGSQLISCTSRQGLHQLDAARAICTQLKANWKISVPRGCLSFQAKDAISILAAALCHVICSYQF